MILPNYFTLLRMILIPVLVVVFYLPYENSNWIAAGIFLIAALTDWLDGWIARNQNLTSKFGAFLDPVADKLLVAVTLVLLVSKLTYLAIPALIIVCREIVVSALREWMAEIGKRASVTVSYIGKIKTVMQMVALFFLLAYQPTRVDQQILQDILAVIGYTALYSAAILTLWSMFLYLKVAWPDLVRDLFDSPK